MKKNKEILKQAGVMSFLYLILCLGGAYESYYRGADLKLTARIAGCVLLLMWGGIFIFIIKLVDCLEKCLICRHIRRFAD